MTTFAEKLTARWERGLFVCVGLDPDLGRIPVHLKDGNDWSTILTFLTAIAEATHPFAAAFKPNLAFFARRGAIGWSALEDLVLRLRALASDIPIILDAKYEEVDHTNTVSAGTAFKQIGADAVTVGPYCGGAALKSFLQSKGRGVFVVCHTSNGGADEFQGVTVTIPSEEVGHFQESARLSHAKIPLYQYVAYRAAHCWSGAATRGLVVGATAPEAIASVRRIAGDKTILLIPGIGEQGGDVRRAVRAGKNRDGKGFLIAPTRSVIYASGGRDFADAAQAAARLTQEIQGYVR